MGGSERLILVERPPAIKRGQPVAGRADRKSAGVGNQCSQLPQSPELRFAWPRGFGFRSRAVGGPRGLEEEELTVIVFLVIISFHTDLISAEMKNLTAT